MTRPEITGKRRYERNKGLANYIGVSTMSIHRWKRDPDLNTPPSSVVNGIEYNDLDDWDAWLKARAVSHVQKLERA